MLGPLPSAHNLQWPKHVVVDKLYTPGNIVVLRLPYPYRIITVGSNKHNGDDAL